MPLILHDYGRTRLGLVTRRALGKKSPNSTGSVSTLFRLYPTWPGFRMRRPSRHHKAEVGQKHKHKHHTQTSLRRVTPTSLLCPRYKCPSRSPFLSNGTESAIAWLRPSREGKNDELDGNAYEAGDGFAYRCPTEAWADSASRSVWGSSGKPYGAPPSSRPLMTVNPRPRLLDDPRHQDSNCLPCLISPKGIFKSAQMSSTTGSLQRLSSSNSTLIVTHARR